MADNLLDIFRGISRAEYEVWEQSYHQIIPGELAVGIGSRAGAVVNATTPVHRSLVDSIARDITQDLVRNFDTSGDGTIQRGELLSRVQAAREIVRQGLEQNPSSLLLNTALNAYTAVESRIGGLPENINIRPEVLADMLDTNRDGAITPAETQQGLDNGVRL
ncbi:MAG: hypothetical protein ACOYJ2_02845, partial [Rickettsiales bacterium]